jgi:hypothetical protein
MTPLERAEARRFIDDELHAVTGDLRRRRLLQLAQESLREHDEMIAGVQKVADEMKREAATPVRGLFARGDIVRHVRSQHTYTVEARCTFEPTLADCYAYRGSDGVLWIRPAVVMEDGRFVRVTQDQENAS